MKHRLPEAGMPLQSRQPRFGAAAAVLPDAPECRNAALVAKRSTEMLFEASASEAASVLVRETAAAVTNSSTWMTGETRGSEATAETRMAKPALLAAEKPIAIGGCRGAVLESKKSVHYPMSRASFSHTSISSRARCGTGGSDRSSRTRPLILFLAILYPAVAEAAIARTPPAPPPRIPYGMAVLQARYPQHPWHTPVESSDTPRGPTRSAPPPIPFVRARSDADLAALYDENLDLDLAPWRRRNRTQITVSELLRWANGLPFKASQRVLIIKGGRLGLLGQRGGSRLKCERPCDPVMESLIADLRSWLAAAATNASEPAWPDVAFFVNVGDTSLCQSWEAAEADLADAAGDDAAAALKQQGSRRRQGQLRTGVGAARRQMQEAAGDAGSGGDNGGVADTVAGGVGPGQQWRGRRRRRRGGSPYGPCPAPVLSLIKEWGKRKDEDILVPITVGIKQLTKAPLSYFPPQHKLDAAVFRGREYCHTKHAPYAADTCSRTYFAAMSAFNPEWSRFLDVGFVDNYTTRGADGALRTIPAAGFVSTQELARFRYTLALDGITASSRLAQLLSLNSVVLKQTSSWIEWYYRSLVPGTHYISFWNHHRTDVLQTIKYLRHKARYLQDVSTHGQAFAYRYLSPDARRLYWRRALSEYGRLFADMNQFVASQAIPESEDV